MDTIHLHTDGACSGNPGPGGFAAIIQREDQPELVVTGGHHHTTNNRMELAAVIEGLRAINASNPTAPLSISVHSDSQYVTNAFNLNWLQGWIRHGWRNSKRQPVPNRDLWEQLLAQIKGQNVQWLWVKGHSGNVMNERCDRLAVAAVSQRRTSLNDDGYWTSASEPASEPATLPQTQPAHAPEPANPEPADHNPADPGTEALRLIREISQLLAQDHQDFPAFRERANQLLAEATW